MRKSAILSIVFLTLLLAGSSANAQDQKIGYFDSEFILAQIPEYNGIAQRLQLLSDNWNLELQEMEEEITALEEDYAAKEILYTQEIRAQKRTEIQQKKQELDTFLNQKFGPEGEYFQSQNDLLEPIQRQVFTAVRAVAQRQGYDFVFDRAGDIYMVYARADWNMNDAILIELGIEVDQ